VRERYAAAATTVTSGHGYASCCDDSGGCCGPTMVEVDETFGSSFYATYDLESLPVAAVEASLGCGNPTAVSELHEGETSSTLAPVAASTCCCRRGVSGRPGSRTEST
jgi:arsenite methyltransferase